MSVKRLSFKIPFFFFAFFSSLLAFAQSSMSSRLSDAGLEFLLSDAKNISDLAIFSHANKVVILKGETHSDHADRAFRRRVESQLAAYGQGVSLLESLIRGSQLERLYKHNNLSQNGLKIEGLEASSSMLFTAASLARVYLRILLNTVESFKKEPGFEGFLDQQIYHIILNFPNAEKLFHPLEHRLRETVAHLGSAYNTAVADKLLTFVTRRAQWSLTNLPRNVFKLEEIAAAMESKNLDLVINKTYLNAAIKKFNRESYQELLELDILLKSIQVSVLKSANPLWRDAMQATINSPSKVNNAVAVDWRNSDWIEAISDHLRNQPTQIIYSQFGSAHLEPLADEMLRRIPDLRVYSRSQN